MTHPTMFRVSPVSPIAVPEIFQHCRVKISTAAAPYASLHLPSAALGSRPHFDTSPCMLYSVWSIYIFQSTDNIIRDLRGNVKGVFLEGFRRIVFDGVVCYNEKKAVKK